MGGLAVAFFLPFDIRDIGLIIIENGKYGSGFIENLARDIKSAFPEAKGYSVRNLRYMRKFAEMFGGDSNLQAPLADLTMRITM